MFQTMNSVILNNLSFEYQKVYIPSISKYIEVRKFEFMTKTQPRPKYIFFKCETNDNTFTLRDLDHHRHQFLNLEKIKVSSNPHKKREVKCIRIFFVQVRPYKKVQTSSNSLFIRL